MTTNDPLIDAIMTFYKKKGVGAFFSVDFLEEKNEEFCFTVEFPKESLNPQGRVQGGMITSVLDDCTALCVLFSTLGKRFPNSTDLHTTFHRPLFLETAIIRTKILKMGKNIVSVEGKLFNQKEKLVASCLHTGFLFDTHGMNT